MPAKFEFHPIANIFPLLQGSEFDELVSDVKANGVLEKIVIHEGKILDGRNRYRAAEKAGQDVGTEQWNGEGGDPVTFVVSKNIRRRQLTPSQRAMCADKARDLFDKMAKERMAEGGKSAGKGRPRQGVEDLPHPMTGKSRDQAGKAFGVSGKLVDEARIVREHGIPELSSAVEEGRMSVTTAAILSREPEEVQKEEVNKPIRRRSYSSLAAPANDDHDDDGEEEDAPKNGRTGKGVILANEAINCLIRIPKNDPLRKRGFQIVMDWIKANK